MASSICRRVSHRSLRRTLFLSRRLHEGPDTIDELLDRHLAKKDPKRGANDDDESLRRSLTSTRREALSLYRDVLRASRYFMWPDTRGVPWREVLRANARKEFEDARFETDPEVVTRLLIGGREAVQDAVDKLAVAAQKMADQAAEERNKGRR
ncbi:LYR family of Fe/S cluster biogenesis protein [Carex rostrata]